MRRSFNDGLIEERLDLRRKPSEPLPRRFVGGGFFDRPQLASQIGCLLRVGPLGRGVLGVWACGWWRAAIPPGQWGEEGLQAEIVSLQDRIKLVIVATGAAHAHGEENIGGDVGHLAQDLGPLPLDIDLVVFVGSLPQKARGSDGFEVVGKEFVARQLLQDESVVRLVGVERSNDVIAIPPGRRPKGVLSEAITLCIPR